MRAIIIDDENLAVQLIKEYLEDYPNIELLGEFHNGFEGLKAMNELSLDLVFLDISMPKLTGMEMIELIENLPPIIFTTAHEEYAVQAFEKNAVDYLLKPFSKKRFSQAIEKVEKRLLENKHENYELFFEYLSSTEKTINRVVVKESGKIFLIPINEIYFITAAEDYSVISTGTHEYVKHATMKFFEERLPTKTFVRIHRSTIINIDYIKEIQGYSKDTLSIIMKNNKILKTSKNGNLEFKKILNN